MTTIQEALWLTAGLVGALLLSAAVALGLILRQQRAHHYKERVHDAEALARQTNLYATLSQCNQAIMRCTSEEELFPQICRIAVQFGGMMAAWIGLIETDTRMLKPVASFGDTRNYLDNIEISVDVDGPFGNGMASTAIRENRPFWFLDYLKAPIPLSWRERSVRAGITASAALPLHRNGVVIGALGLYSAKVNAFDEQARELLVEMAANIDFALDNFEHEAARKRIDDALRESEQQFRGLVEQGIAGIYIIQDGKFTYVNQRYAEILGYASAVELIGRESMSVVAEKDRGTIAENVRQHIEGKETNTTFEFTALRKDGSMTVVSVHGTRVIHNGQSAVIGLIQDISQKRRAEEEIQQLAFHDPLTRLPNRRLLLDRLQQALASSSRSRHQGALLFLDLDDFKTLNDTLGHDVGDLLLRQVAQRLSSCIRAVDTVARLGGDEFVVMLEDLSDNAKEAASQTKTVGEKIIAALNQPYLLGGHQHHSTPSIGATLFSGHNNSVDELLKRADLAMYQSKAAGRNTLRFYDPEMQAAVTARAALEADLRQGLEQHQFLLFYQPQVDKAYRMTGAEALIRWQHPLLGLLSPVDFVPLAEKTGLILPLGRWVLETAAAQLARWTQQPESAQLTLSINVSARQFRNEGFVAQVLAVLDQSGADPRKLKLELTESLLLSDVEDAIAKMAALKARGVGFALDDFGTGYSSLSYLKRLPLEQLKIDQSFVQNILIDSNDTAIARMIMALAESMGLEVIAEGVETKEQMEFLASLNCHAFQGYLFGRPSPVEEFNQKIKQPD